MILYYSNYCENCRKILPTLAQSQNKKDIHFISIDNRILKEDGSTYIILPNQQEIVLPNTVTKVPALLLLNRGNQVIYGNDITKHLQPVNYTNSQEQIRNVEPDAFSLGDINNCGVMSDNFSFLDQSVESLSAKGDGGLRQIRNNTLLEHVDAIETPPDNYQPNTIGNTTSMDKIQQERSQLLQNK